MAVRFYSNTTEPMALGGGGVDDNDLVLTVASTSGTPSVPFTLGVERGTDDEEVMLCTAKTATTMTVTRGYDNTVPVAHGVGVAVEHCVCAIDFSEANTHVNATGDIAASADVHTQYALRRALTTKGDFYVATAAGIVVRLPVGTDRLVLTADSSQTPGVKYDKPIPTGTIIMYGGTAAPNSDWFILDGSLADKTTDAVLYAIVGDAFNVGGEGANQFRLPDVRGRGLIGVGTGSGLTARTRGERGGSETHTLTIAQIPSHQHLWTNGQFSLLYNGGTGYGVNFGGGQGFSTGGLTGLTGGSGSHPIMQPFLALNFLIRR